MSAWHKSLTVCTGFRRMRSEKEQHMLCPELPPRIYESLKTLCCLAGSEKPLQADAIAAATDLPPAQTTKILQQMAWPALLSPAGPRKADSGWLSQRPIFVWRRLSPCSLTPARQSKKRSNAAGIGSRHLTMLKEFSRITIADLGELISVQDVTTKRTVRTKSLKVLKVRSWV